MTSLPQNIERCGVHWNLIFFLHPIHSEAFQNMSRWRHITKRSIDVQRLVLTSHSIPFTWKHYRTQVDDVIGQPSIEEFLPSKPSFTLCKWPHRIYCPLLWSKYEFVMRCNTPPLLTCSLWSVTWATLVSYPTIPDVGLPCYIPSLLCPFSLKLSDVTAPKDRLI